MELRLKEDELDKIVELIKRSGKRVVLLKGPLGSGKTTLVKAFAKDEDVTSPTFSIQQVYGGDIYHYDLYNAGFGKFMELGLFEELFKDGYHFIEWADEELEKMLKAMGLDYMKIEIEPEGDKRVYRMEDA